MSAGSSDVGGTPSGANGIHGLATTEACSGVCVDGGGAYDSGGCSALAWSDGRILCWCLNR